MFSLTAGDRVEPKRFGSKACDAAKDGVLCQERNTARNQLWGRVAAIHDGSVNDEVSIELPNGRSVTAVVTRGSCESLALAPGVEACALFKSSSVILATYS